MFGLISIWGTLLVILLYGLSLVLDTHIWDHLCNIADLETKCNILNRLKATELPLNHYIVLGVGDWVRFRKVGLGV